MEAIATALGVEVAKVQASTIQERVRLRSLRSGRLDDGGRHGGRKLLSFFVSFERTVVQIVVS